MRLRLGTRSSPLALAQTRIVEEALRAAWPGMDIEVVPIRTRGDELLATPIEQLGGKGVFTEAIEQALIEKLIDVAVHSLKDLPAEMSPKVMLGPTPRRGAVDDVLIAPAPVDWRSKPLRIGTSSLRRRAQLLRLNSNLRPVEMRGNVETRIAKLLRGEYDAIVLAAAGIERLQIKLPWSETLDPGEFLPAPGQGALGLQLRRLDSETATLLEAIGDKTTAACVLSERALMKALGGGCFLPLGALAAAIGQSGDVVPGHEGSIALEARLLTPDGRRVIEASGIGGKSTPEELGARVAGSLLQNGGEEIVRILQQQGHGQ